MDRLPRKPRPLTDEEKAYMQAFGIRLASARVAAQLTQEEAARTVGFVGPAHLSYIENGHASLMRVWTLAKIIQVYGVDPGWLLTGTHEDRGNDDDDTSKGSPS